MKYSIRTILWVFALVASSMATFGLPGIAVAFFVMVFWLKFFCLRDFSLTLVELLVIIAVVGTIVGLSIGPGHDLLPMRRARCVRQMEDLAIAVLHYGNRHGHLPKDFLTASGKELSWRVLVAPDIGHADLCKQYGLNAQWNALNETTLRSEYADSLECPTWHRNEHNPSRYYAISGRDTFWAPEPDPMGQILSDYSCDTIMLIEAAEQSVDWFEAGDLTVETAIKLLTTEPQWKNGDGHLVRNSFFGFLYKPDVSRCVAFSDGSVRLLRTPLPRKLAVALLTANGGEWQIRDELDRYSRPQFDYGRVWGFTLFCIVTAMPVLGRKKLARTQPRSYRSPENQNL
ncbi:MAG: DUF1559 domain-containing protein [Planctomycetes bacterium]|nr:DUF1559 domain-containing protein [Planctomycetota bacterium]